MDLDGRASRIGWIVAVSFALASMACNPTPSVIDGGGDGGSTIPATELPRIDERPCPDGYRVVEDEIGTLCDPWPEGGASECTPGQAHFPGEPGCAALSATCPEDRFPPALDATLFVDSESTATRPDGSRSAPFTSVVDALAVAEAGDVVQLSRGVFEEDEEIIVPAGVALRGACAEGTTLGDRGRRSIVLNAQSALSDMSVHDNAVSAEGQSSIRGVHVSILPAPYFRLSAISVSYTAAGDSFVALERVRVSGAALVSIVSHGGSVRADRLDLSGATFNGGGARFELSRIHATNGLLFSTIDSVSLSAVVASKLAILGPAPDTELAHVLLSAGAEPPPSGPDDLLIPSFYYRTDEEAELDMSALRVESGFGSGLHFVGPVIVEARQTTIRDIAMAMGEAAPTWGSAVVASGGTLRFSDFRLARAALCGLHIGEGVEVDATRGTVQGCTVGACVPAGFDLGRVMEAVHYIGNESNLDSEGLPVPDFDEDLLGVP